MAKKEILCKEYIDMKAEIDRLFLFLKKDAEKFYMSHNKSAGVRLRKKLKSVKIYIDEVMKSSLPRNTTE